MRRQHTTVGVAIWVGCVLAGLAGCGSPHTPRVEPGSQVTLSSQDRLLILAPHPDDEVLGCGGIIQQAKAMGLPVRVVFFTYGDNNQWSFLVYRKHPVLLPSDVQQMGLVRHDEAVAAGRILGLSPEELLFLGYPDFGTFQMWKAHWGDSPPFRSMLTRVTEVPYANALRPGAPYKGEDVVRDLTTVLREFRPTKVFVSHPGDDMPDHAALYLFTRVALWNLERELHPEVYPYLVHLRRWPKPRGFRPATILEPPPVFRETVSWRSFALTPAQINVKRRAIQVHRTQYGYSARYLLSFIRPNELFGDFPIVPLKETTAAEPLSSDGVRKTDEPLEESTEEERAAFVGIEDRFVALEDGALVVSLTFSRPLGKAVEASAFVFGYRADRPFEQMPKIYVSCNEFQQTAYDQARALPAGTVLIKRHAKSVTIRVPLAVLGDPTRVLTSARTYLGDVPLDWASWRVLELPQPSESPGRPLAATPSSP